MRLRSFCLFALVLFCASTGFARSDDVTFNNQVVRILQQHCQTCHRPGSIAPFSLLTYQDARSHAFQMQTAVESREMPPWKPVDPHGTFEDERILTDTEIKMISDWVNAGAPEGNASDLPEPITFPSTWSSGTPDAVVQPPNAYPLQAGANDIYRCFPMPVSSQTDLYVRGYELIPGNRSIVHHVLLFIDTGGQSDALDAADPGPGYTCFGGAGFVSGLGGLGGWVPGASPQMFPLGTGVKIPAGARIVMQIHYSTSQVSPTAMLDPDLTRLGLYLSTTPLAPISFLPVVNPFFTIPAGDPHYQVKAATYISNTVELVSVAPHMHLLGRQATVIARFPDGSTRQLVRIDDWDFHWQGNYIFRDPIILPSGTVVEMTAYYDNSSDNPNNPSNPPVPVSWGERTTDEMCLTFLSVKAPGIPWMNTVPFSLSDRSTESLITQGGDSSTTQVGYARVTNSAGLAPSGLAIFGNRSGGVLISEAGVPAAPLLTQGRIYGESSTFVRSGLALANPNSDPAVLSFTFTDESGRDVYSNSATIDPNSQIAAFLDESPFSGPAAFLGSFTFTSSKPVSVVAVRGAYNERSEFLMTTLPVVDLNSVGSTAVFPYFADGAGWTTTILLVNPTSNAISGLLQFADKSGNPISSLNYSIPANGARRLGTSGTSSSVSSGSISVVPAQNNAAPAGSLVFSYGKLNTPVTQAGVPATPSGNAFRVYVEASDGVQSGIAITNTSLNTATVHLELINSSGAPIATTNLTIPAHAQITGFLNELAGFQTLSLPIQGLLRITSAVSVGVVGLRKRTNERNELLITTTPPVAENASSLPELVFPHFADGGGFTTQFIMFGAGSSTAVHGSLRFFSRTGQAMQLQLK